MVTLTQCVVIPGGEGEAFLAFIMMRGTFADMVHAFRQKWRYALIILGIVLVAIVLAARVRLRHSSQTKADLQSNSLVSRRRLEGEVVALSWTGFEPRVISRSAGPFVLLVNNYSHLPVATLLVERDGNRVRTILLPKEKRNWSDTIDLPPGNYNLREAAHSNWSCQISLR